MTIQEWRKHEEYKEGFKKIEGYHKGFEWTMEWYKIPEGKANALRILLGDCKKAGLIKSTSIGYGFVNDKFCETEETFKRI